MHKGKFRQDMPPEGGYQSFNIARTLPKKLLKPGLIIGTGAFCLVYGVAQIHMIKRQRLTEKFVDTDIFAAMEPFLTAERDRYHLKIVRQNRDFENEVMKDVPGWKTGTWYGEPVYFTLGEKWWDPKCCEFFAHVSKDRMKDEMHFEHHSEYAGPHWYDKYIPQWYLDWSPFY